ncbi:MAG: hypothetical protein H6828_16660 [Planctomycetes bacterium]|nr:hypothetical protein [Planctomycetota bacterium]
MSDFATRRRNRRARRGTAMVGALVVVTGLFGLLVATSTISSVEVREARRALDEVRVQYVAEAGVERAMAFLDQASLGDPTDGPLAGLENLFGAGETITPFVGTGLVDGNAQVGAFTVRLTRLTQSPDGMTIQIDATGYLPDAPVNLPAGRRVQEWSAASVVVEYTLEPSEVFDYAYFINNWGWFYGSTIFSEGNVRSNGQFDVAGYSPTVNGQPLYEGVDYDGSTASLSGYQDDNGDGLQDGNDGGVFSGWDIIGAQNLKGTGGNDENQHDFQGRVDMPNLTELDYYEQRATAYGSGVSIGGSSVSDAVYGDEPGETGNLYLKGTAANPIVLDGPLVVRGDVILSGYVTGQGAIYCGGNVYVPDSIEYVNPPSEPRPDGTTQEETEAWLADNWDKDFLGLFARENIVVGDHTSSTWRSYVGGWMSSSMNSSKEDAGEDGIPNTRAGMDGILGTADDDVLEGDGVFTTDVYTEADLAYGLIPAGKSVGDVVPGSGEDIDGDGVYDGTTTLDDVTLTTPMDTAHWGGNMPAGGISKWKDIATNYANRLDAVFYTNHSFCYVVLGSDPAEINGALVSRNENIVYGTPKISMNHDARLLGGNSGMAGSLLPQMLREPAVLSWRRLDRDPNHYAGIEE